MTTGPVLDSYASQCESLFPRFTSILGENCLNAVTGDERVPWWCAPLQISLSSSHPVLFAHWTDVGHPSCQAEVFLWEQPVRGVHDRAKPQDSPSHPVTSWKKSTSYFQPVSRVILIDLSLFSQRQVVWWFGQWSRPVFPRTVRAGTGRQGRGVTKWRRQGRPCLPNSGQTRTCLCSVSQTSGGQTLLEDPACARPCLVILYLLWLWRKRSSTNILPLKGCFKAF